MVDGKKAVFKKVNNQFERHQTGSLKNLEEDASFKIYGFRETSNFLLLREAQMNPISNIIRGPLEQLSQITRDP